MGVVVKKSTFILCLIVCLIATGCSKASQDHILDISDIDYYTQRMEFHKQMPFFPREIPPNAKTTYHFYQYDTSTLDEWLELNFENENDMSSFLDSILSEIPEGKLVKRSSPYNNQYTEYFCSSICATTGGTDSKKNFDFWEYYNDSHLGAFFHSLNVSTDELKIVITFSQGKFETNQYTPMYLQFFQIPINDTLRDYVEFPPENF